MARDSVASVRRGFIQQVLEDTSRNSTGNLWNYCNATPVERLSTPRAPLEIILEGCTKYTSHNFYAKYNI